MASVRSFTSIGRALLAFLASAVLSLLGTGSPSDAREGDLSLVLNFNHMDARMLGPPMDPVRAMLEIRRPLDARYPSAWPCERNAPGPSDPISSYTATRRQLTIRCANNVDYVIAFSDIRQILVERNSRSANLVRLDAIARYPNYLTLYFPDEAQARTVWNAFYWLAHPSQLPSPETEADFQASVAAARIAGDRTEARRRAQVQAEALLAQNSPVDAALLYRDALTASPDWAQGHYNLALVYGSLQLYSEAITEMRRYLYLEPNAPDARAAQDQIYGWEALVGTSGGL